MYTKIYKLFYSKNHLLLLKYRSKKVWFFIIKLIIKSTFDFNYAIEVRKNHFKIIKFFKDYPILQPKKLNIKIFKCDKIKYTKDYYYIEFEMYFRNKNELIKILKYKNEKCNEFVINKEKLNQINVLTVQLEKLNIEHYKFEIEKSYNNNYKLKFEKYNYNYDKILTSDLKIFLIINDLCNIKNIGDKIFVYYSIYDDDEYQNLIFMKNLIKTLKKEDINKFNTTILTEYQKNNLECLKKIINNF